MNDLFLIAHKVRGEPAFDVAQRLQIGDEEGWIIPTSGHRAYPWYAVALRDLHLGTSNVPVTSVKVQDLDINTYPDHYACNDRPLATSAVKINLQALGLVRPKPKIERRL